MGFFGTAFCSMGVGPVIGWTSPLLLLPITLFAFITMRAVALLRRGTTVQLGTPHADKVIMWSSIGEGIGIFIVVNVLGNLDRRDLILPGIATVVGLHFIPMAYAIPFHAFYAVAAALLIAATAGMLLRQPIGSEVAGIAAAVALWIASLTALRRGSIGTASPT